MLSKELLAFYRQISLQSFTVVDVETTGRYAVDDRVIEISVLYASLADGIQHQQTDLINPEIKIPSKIRRFTGISQDMVDEAPLAADVFPAYLPLLNTGILTAHNIEFDYRFLQAEYQRVELSFSRPETEQLCTVQLARLMLPDLPSRSLPHLVTHFQFNVDCSHRAEADTIACWLLTKQLLTDVMNEDDDVLLARFARQWMPLRHAAKLLGCTQKETKHRLKAAGIPFRFVGQGKGGTFMYYRGDVEKIFHQQQEQQNTTQLSFL